MHSHITKRASRQIIASRPSFVDKGESFSPHTKQFFQSIDNLIASIGTIILVKPIICSGISRVALIVASLVNNAIVIIAISVIALINSAISSQPVQSHKLIAAIRTVILITSPIMSGIPRITLAMSPYGVNRIVEIAVSPIRLIQFLRTIASPPSMNWMRAAHLMHRDGHMRRRSKNRGGSARQAEAGEQNAQNKQTQTLSHNCTSSSPLYTDKKEA